MYENYKRARNAAWQILIKYNVNKLPVDIFDICRQEGFLLFPYSEAGRDLQTLRLLAHSKRTDGFSMRYHEHLLLFYDDSKSRQRQRFTLGHELGHYLNGDISDTPTSANAEPAPKDDFRETQANITASRILSPACVLWKLGATDGETISRLCDISITAARWRAGRMQELLLRDQEYRNRYGRSCFLMSAMERRVYAQFFGWK